MNITQIEREVNRKRQASILSKSVSPDELIKVEEKDELSKALPLPKREDKEPKKKKKKKKNGEEVDEGDTDETEKTEKSLIVNLDDALERLEKSKYIKRTKKGGKWVYVYKEGTKITSAKVKANKGDGKGNGDNKYGFKKTDVYDFKVHQEATGGKGDVGHEATKYADIMVDDGEWTQKKADAFVKYTKENYKKVGKAKQKDIDAFLE